MHALQSSNDKICRRKDCPKRTDPWTDVRGTSGQNGVGNVTKPNQDEYEYEYEYELSFLCRIDDRPTIDKDGYKAWYRNGVLHREIGPAVIFEDGTEYWYFEGTRFRSNTLQEFQEMIRILKVKRVLES